MTTYVYYDAEKKQATLSKRTRNDLGKQIGIVSGPPINTNKLVDGLLRNQGIVTAGITIITTPLE